MQLIWSRWQEQLAGSRARPVAALIGAKLGRGTVSAPAGSSRAARAHRRSRLRRANSASGCSATRPAGRRSTNVGGEADPLALEGAMPPYAHPPTSRSIMCRCGSACRPGGCAAMRHGYHRLLHRELHRRAGAASTGASRCPTAWHARAATCVWRECLQRAARLARMGRRRRPERPGPRLPPHRRGRSCGRIACVATARRGEGGVRVDQLSAVVDIGRIVNLDIARQQIEGGLIFGLGLALGAPEYEDGVPTDDAARLARPADAGRLSRNRGRFRRQRGRAVRSGRTGRGGCRAGHRQCAVFRDRACASAACRCFRTDCDLDPAAAQPRHIPRSVAAASACCWSISARPMRRPRRR